MVDVAIASYPFTTITPNKGVGFVRIDCVDKEFNTQCNPRFGFCVDHQRFVPVDVIDVAGLVPGAHEGKGMGNQFLDDLRQADVLIHVVDASGSTNEKGENVEAGSYDPVFDVSFLEVELDMWYLSVLKKGWERFARKIQQEHSDIVVSLAKQLSGLNVNELLVKDAVHFLKLTALSPTLWTEEHLHQLAVFFRKKTKPMIIAANKTDVPVAENNVKRLKEKFSDYVIVPCSAEAELALREALKSNLIKYVPGNADFEIIGNLSDKQKNGLDYIKKNIMVKFGSTGVQNVLNTSVFSLLKYFVVFPGGVNKLEDKDGNRLPDCFLMPQNTTALDFAFKLHTDLGKHFISAIDVKTKRRVGREHLLKHRDVIEIVSGK